MEKQTQIEEFEISEDLRPTGNDIGEIAYAVLALLENPKINVTRKLLIAHIGLKTIRNMRAITLNEISRLTGTESKIDPQALIRRTNESIKKVLGTIEIQSTKHPENKRYAGFFAHRTESEIKRFPKDFDIEKAISSIEEKIQQLQEKFNQDLSTTETTEDNSLLSFKIAEAKLPSPEEMALIRKEVERLTLEDGPSQNRMAKETKHILSILLEATENGLDATSEYIKIQLRKKGIKLTREEITIKIQKIREYLPKTGRIHIKIESEKPSTNNKIQGHHLRMKTQNTEDENSKLDLPPPIIRLSDQDYDLLEKIIAYAMEWTHPNSYTTAILECFQEACAEHRSLTAYYCKVYALANGFGDIPTEQFTRILEANTIVAFKALGIRIKNRSGKFQVDLPRSENARRDLEEAINKYFKKPTAEEQEALQERVMDSLRHFPSKKHNEENSKIVEKILEESKEGRPTFPMRMERKLKKENVSSTQVHKLLHRITTLAEERPEALGYITERIRGSIKFVLTGEYKRQELPINIHRTAETTEIPSDRILDLDKFNQEITKNPGGYPQTRRITEFVAKCSAEGKAVSGIYVAQTLGLPISQAKCIRSSAKKFISQHAPDYEVFPQPNNTFYIALFDSKYTENLCRNEKKDSDDDESNDDYEITFKQPWGRDPLVPPRLMLHGKYDTYLSRLREEELEAEQIIARKKAEEIRQIKRTIGLGIKRHR